MLLPAPSATPVLPNTDPPTVYALLPLIFLMHSAGPAPGWLPLRWQATSAALYALSGVTAVNAAIAFCLAKFTLFPHGLAGRLLNSRGLVWVGTLSYSLYVWQQLFIKPLAPAFPQKPGINLAFIAAAASLSYFGLERPLRGLRRHLPLRSWTAAPAPRPVTLASVE